MKKKRQIFTLIGYDDSLHMSLILIFSPVQLRKHADHNSNKKFKTVKKFTIYIY